MSTQKRADIQIAADEINALIHAYLVDSGFIHSAFVFRGEANLDRSPLAKMLFPRGQLTELLAKALLYIEVETHWKQLPGSCNQSFSLTGAHTCQFNPGKNTSALEHSTFNAMEEDEDETPIAGLRRPHSSDEEMESTGFAESGLRPPGKNELSPALQRFIPSHSQEVFQCSWNPIYGDILATGSKDSRCAVWNLDIPRGRPSHEDRLAVINHCQGIPMDQERDVSCIEWNRDGTQLATASMDHYVRIWSMSTKSLYFCLKQHTDTVGLARFSPNGKQLLSVGLDSTTILWDIEKKKVLREYQAPIVENGPGLQDIAWVNDTSFALTWPGGLIHIFFTTASMPFRTFRGHKEELNMVRVSPDRKLLASIGDDKTVRIWAIEPLKMMVKDGEVVPVEGSVGGEDGQGCNHVLRAHKKPVMNCRWAPPRQGSSDKIFVSVSDDFTVCIWDAVAGTLLKMLTDHEAEIYGLAMSPDAQYYVTTSMDGWLYIYSASNWEMVCSWTDRSEPEKKRKRRNLYEVEWHKDGQCLAVCTASGDMAILDVSHLKAKPADPSLP